MILYGYVIMWKAAPTNHFHLIIQSKNENLLDFIRDFKAFLGREIIKTIQKGSESRSYWMLKVAFRLQQNLITEMRKISVRGFSFGIMEIMLRKYSQKNSFGQSKVGRCSAIFI